MASITFATNTAEVWHTWTTSGTTASANYTTTDVWDNWVTTGTGSTTIHLWQRQQPVWEVWEQTEEDRAERQRQHDEWQARREQRNREALAQAQRQREDEAEARERAMTLLYDVLTNEERLAFEETEHIIVEGQDGHLYRIETHRDTVHGNIVRTDDHGCVLGRACVAPQMYGDGVALPTADGWVGQYLGLKFDTVEFLSHANWSGIQRCLYQRAVAA